MQAQSSRLGEKRIDATLGDDISASHRASRSFPFLLESGGNILHRELKMGLPQPRCSLGVYRTRGECNRQKDCQS